LLEQPIYSRRYLIKAVDGGWELDFRRSARRPHCDCGQLAVAAVQFGQLTVGEQEPTLGVLPLCRSCLDAFTADEQAAVVSVNYFEEEQWTNRQPSG
jgi:hypothetical protein